MVGQRSATKPHSSRDGSTGRLARVVVGARTKDRAL